MPQGIAEVFLAVERILKAPSPAAPLGQGRRNIAIDDQISKEDKVALSIALVFDTLNPGNGFIPVGNSVDPLGGSYVAEQHIFTAAASLSLFKSMVDDLP